jgi:hypothetical protein
MPDCSFRGFAPGDRQGTRGAGLLAQAWTVPEAFGQLSQRDNCHPPR